RYVFRVCHVSSSTISPLSPSTRPTPRPHSFPTRRSSDLVSASGLVTAVGNGSAHAIATTGGLSAQVTVSVAQAAAQLIKAGGDGDRKSTRLNSSHEWISYAVFCLKKKTTKSAVTSTARRE